LLAKEGVDQHARVISRVSVACFLLAKEGVDQRSVVGVSKLVAMLFAEAILKISRSSKKSNYFCSNRLIF
jgi:hypothetical protein